MTQILVQGEVILAQGPFVETDDEIRSNDAVYPKRVIDGWEIVEVEELPSDFTLNRYSYIAGELQLSAAAIEADNQRQIENLKNEIVQIEISTPITLRAQREQVLIIRELIKQVTGSYPNTVGFNKAVNLEAQIAAIRAQLLDLGG